MKMYKVEQDYFTKSGCYVDTNVLGYFLNKDTAKNFAMEYTDDDYHSQAIVVEVEVVED